MRIIWKKVTDKRFSDHYEISSAGDVRRTSIVPYGRSTFIGKILKKNIRGKKNRYHYVILFNKGFYKHFYIHRLVAEAFIENPNCVNYVNHKNGNKIDNNISNLEWVTCKENVNHAVSIGLFKKNGSNVKTKLKKEDVEIIRKTFIKSSKTNGLVALSKRFNVSPRCIADVIKNVTWKHVLPLFL